MEKVDMNKIINSEEATGDFIGRIVCADGTVLFDRRYTVDSPQYKFYGPRTCDLNIEGPEVVIDTRE